MTLEEFESKNWTKLFRKDDVFSEEIPLPYKLCLEYDDATFNENYVILIDELYSGTTRSRILEKHRSIPNKLLK